MKKMSLLFASCAMLALASCGSDELIDNSLVDVPVIEVDDDGLALDPYNYVYIPDGVKRSELEISKPGSSYYPSREQWIGLDSHENMVKKLQLSASTISSLSTLELIDVCMNYPFNGDILAFNYLNYGVFSVCRDFNGFAALKARKDAFEKLLYYYDLKLENIKKAGFKEGYIDCVFHMRFIENFIISGYIYPVDDLKKCNDFRNLVLKAGKVKNQYEGFEQSHYSETQYDLEYVAGFHPGEQINPLLYAPDSLMEKFK